MKIAIVLATLLAIVLGGCASLRSRSTLPLPAACRALLTPLELEYGWGEVPQYPGVLGMTMEDAKRVVERVLRGEECATAAKGALGAE